MKESIFAQAAGVVRCAVIGGAVGGALLVSFSLLARIPSCSSELYACGTIVGILGALALMVGAFPLVLIFGFQPWLVPANLAAVGAVVGAARAFFQTRDAAKAGRRAKNQ
jgi:hypothetical protein